MAENDIETAANIRHLAKDLLRLCDKGDIRKALGLLKHSPGIEVGETPLSEKILTWIQSTEGWWSITLLDREAQVSTLEDRNNRATILYRLKKKKIIEPHPVRAEVYRQVITDMEEIDLEGEPGSPVEVRFPFFEDEKLIELYGGEIICIAGAPGTGKTTTALNIIKLNKDKWKCVYFSSEAGRNLLLRKINKFDDFGKRNFKAWFRSANYEQVIDPNGLNIIDYLKIYDNFFEIGKSLDNIWKKLKGNNGIAIVIIQKNPSTKNTQIDYGRGGSFSLETPSLYLAMDWGRIKIVKARNWADHGRNPNGLIREFKIINDAYFAPQGIWHPEVDFKQKTW